MFSMKQLPLYFSTLILFAVSSAARADGFSIEILSNGVLSDASSLLDSLKLSYPVALNTPNARGEVLTSLEYFKTADGRKIGLDCLLRNSARQEVMSGFGLNDSGDVLVGLNSRDTKRTPSIAVLHQTGELIESYCPIVTWSIDESCRVNLLPNIQFNNSDQVWSLSDMRGNLYFPVTSDRNLYLYQNENYGPTGFDGAVFSKTAHRYPYCNIGVTLRSPNDGSLLLDQQLVVSLSAGDPEQYSIILSKRTSSNGSAKLRLNIHSLVEKNLGRCGFVGVEFNTPFESEKWVTRSLQTHFFENCI